MTKLNPKPKSGLFKDIKGQIFGRWTVGEYAGKQYWNCVCQCGTKSKVFGPTLRNGKSKSCGCFQKDNPPVVTHGQTRNKKSSPEFRCWVNMRNRCFNPKCEFFKYYGGRGIQVCKRWADSFEAFFEDMGKRPSPNHSIDRINNDGDYEPSNCRWATTKEQSINTSRSRTMTHNGETKRISEWAEEYGIEYSVLYKQVVYRNWPPSRALR